MMKPGVGYGTTITCLVPSREKEKIIHKTKIALAEFFKLAPWNPCMVNLGKKEEKE